MEELILKSRLERDEDRGLGVPKILTIGCGGAGNNGINRLASLGIKGAKTIAINTDQQALNRTEADMKILIGKNITRGMGSGGDPKLAKRCLDVSRYSMEKILKGADLVFITAGMGGGTGTGISGEIARMAEEAGAIVIAIVTTPFSIERDRHEKAQRGVEELTHYAHSLIVLDNNRLMELVGNKPIDKAFMVIDQFLAETIKGITEVITEPSLINLDFNDVRSILSHGGWSSLLYGEASDMDPSLVIENALNNPIMQVDISGASGALVHITCGKKLSLLSMQEIADGITDGMDEDANVILGARIDPRLDGTVRVMSIVTGVDEFLMDTLASNGPASKPENWDKWDIPTVY